MGFLRASLDSHNALITSAMSRDDACDSKNKRIWELYRSEIDDNLSVQEIASKYNKKLDRSSLDFSSMLA